MRLIDADALLDKQESLYMRGHVLFHGVTAYTLENAPTIEVQLPVAHGRWSWCTENKYRCTNCGRHTRVDEVMDEPVYNYCPYCGAKMDGGANQ